MKHTFISLGFNCRPAFHLRRRGDHHVFPLDWLGSPHLSSVVELIVSDFNGFLDRKNFQPDQTTAQNGWFHTKYRIHFVHDGKDDWTIGSNLPAWMNLLQKRVDKFKEIAGSQPVIFIRESGTAAELDPLFEKYPRSKALLINPGEFQLIRRTERVEEWTFPPEDLTRGPDVWVHNSDRWDRVLNEIQNLADSGWHIPVDGQIDAR